MHASIAKKLAKKMKRQAGFTLLEILVVLTIMGFLIAMVAPRLAGISGDAVDTVCDSNQNRMITMMSGYFEKTNRYPNKLTNIVEQTGATTYQIPAVSDNDPENGAETLASELFDRNQFGIHHLTAKEVAELKNMGIVTLFNLNSYDGIAEDGLGLKSDYTPPVGTTYAAITSRNATMDQVTPATGLGVCMIGLTSPDASTAPTLVTTTEFGWGESDFLGRIVLGFGPENGLVTSGIVSNAAHCPGGIQNADNVTYNDYNVVLPRLQSTVDRFAASSNLETMANDGYTALSYTEDYDMEATYDMDVNSDNLMKREYKLAAQETYQYATICPEGHKFPADDGDFWAIDFNDNDIVD